MLGHVYYHGLLEKYDILFGSIFKTIVIERESSDGVKQTISVPVNRANRDASIERIKADPSLIDGRPVALTLPRLSFKFTDFRYDGHRKLGRGERNFREISNDPNKFKFVYQSVPYDIITTLWVYTEYEEDGYKIIEQILPMFQPDWNASVHLMPDMELSHDTSIELNSVRPDDSFYGYDQRRINVWELQFTIKAMLYGPIYNKPIIKFVDINTFLGTPEQDIEDRVGNIHVSPGLTANGEPTSNSSLTIDPNDIFAHDNYGYIVTKTGRILIPDN